MSEDKINKAEAVAALRRCGHPMMDAAKMLTVALETMGEYEERLIGFGDPENLVYSEIHLRWKDAVKSVIADLNGAATNALHVLLARQEDNKQ